MVNDSILATEVISSRVTQECCYSLCGEEGRISVFCLNVMFRGLLRTLGEKYEKMLVLVVDPRTSMPLAETVVPEFWFLISKCMIIFL